MKRAIATTARSTLAIVAIAGIGCSRPDYVGEYTATGTEELDVGSAVLHEPRAKVVVSIVPADGDKAYTVKILAPQRAPLSLYLTRAQSTAGGEGIAYDARAAGVTRPVRISSAALSGSAKSPRLRITASDAIFEQAAHATLDLQLERTAH